MPPACFVAADGRTLRSSRFAASWRWPSPRTTTRRRRTARRAATWPADFQVTVNLELPRPTGGRRVRRPYVAVWVEDADGKAVRTVTVWGNARRWLPTMSGLWKVAGDDPALVRAVTRATRAPGKYTVVWDGKDDAGKPLPRGTYTIRVEVHREHGKHLFQTGTLVCAEKPTRITLEKNAETGETVVAYGKRK
ncbi:MAG: DUF2271 domain-containing protein [Gemmataceae bacterium]